MFDRSLSGESLRKFGGKERKVRRTKRSYVKFFDGYTEYTETTRSGRKRTRRVYMADYYCRDLSKTALTRRKLVYGVLLAAGIVMFIVSGVQRSLSNYLWYFVLLQAASLIGLAFVLSSVKEYIITPENMTKYSFWKSSEMLKASGKWTAILLWVASAADALTAVVLRGQKMTIAVGCSVLRAFSGICIYLIYWLEANQAEYRIVKNERPSLIKNEDDSFQISEAME